MLFEELIQLVTSNPEALAGVNALITGAQLVKIPLTYTEIVSVLEADQDRYDLSGQSFRLNHRIVAVEDLDSVIVLVRTQASDENVPMGIEQSLGYVAFAAAMTAVSHGDQLHYRQNPATRVGFWGVTSSLRITPDGPAGIVGVSGHFIGIDGRLVKCAGNEELMETKEGKLLIHGVCPRLAYAVIAAAAELELLRVPSERWHRAIQVCTLAGRTVQCTELRDVRYLD